MPYQNFTILRTAFRHLGLTGSYIAVCSSHTNHSWRYTRSSVSEHGNESRMAYWKLYHIAGSRLEICLSLGLVCCTTLWGLKRSADGGSVKGGPRVDLKFTLLVLFARPLLRAIDKAGHLQPLISRAIMAAEKPHPTSTSTPLPAVDIETQSFDPPATKNLLRKLDWHIIPFMSLIYLYVLNFSPAPLTYSI